MAEPRQQREIDDILESSQANTGQMDTLNLPRPSLSQGNEIIEEELSHQQPHQEEINNITVASKTNSRPNPSLVDGPRKIYLEIGVPLYEASIKCDWVAANSILKKKPELVRYSITENGETALHVAASAKGDPKDVKEFVTNLVELMGEKDLELQNNNSNNAFYLAAAAGNIEILKIMLKKNTDLVKIPGAEQMLPLYAAALFGNYDVVKYLYEKSNELCPEDGWTDKNRSWLLQRCVENNMFDIALEIVRKHPLCSGTVLGVLARKPEAFKETHSKIIEKAIRWSKHLYALVFITPQPSEINKHQESGDGINKAPNGSIPEDTETGNGSISEEKHPTAGCRSAPETKFNSIGRTIKSVFALIGSKLGAPEKENTALTLLRFIWEEIAKKPKKEINDILRGPRDSTVSGWVVPMQLQNLISKHVAKLEEETNIITRNPDSTVKVEARQLQTLISERLVNLHAETQKVMNQDNQPVSSKGDQALDLQNLILKNIANTYYETQKIMRNISLEIQVSKLRKVIFEHTEKMRKETQEIIVGPSKATYSSRVLFIAAEMGNTSFLIELIRKYPDLIWKVNDDNQTIFHIAIKHRHEGVYNLLYEIGAMKDLITPLKDLKNNNMLHLVGKIAKQKRLEDVSGVALQMQRELLWFQEVESLIPLSYRERKNKDGLTPYELFRIEHKELVTQGEKWMKGTANRCLVVASLIATIVFAAAYTVPGGYSQTNGIPFFHSKATFMIFVVADAISLLLSSASILIFLSILTSRYAESDFLESLPKKLLSGLLTLFLSIATMTLAFGISFFILYHKGLIWMPILICVFAVLPALLYVRLQYGLFFDVILSTYRSRYLFKPQKHVLYYKNPAV